MRKRMGMFFWSAPPWRALLEALLIIATLLLMMIPVLQSDQLVTESMVLLVFLCGSWAGFRMRPFAGNRLGVIVKEFLAATLLTAGFAALCEGIPPLLNHREFLTRATIGGLGLVLLIAAIWPGYLTIRVVSWAWIFWDRLRRKRFLWSLTHAHMTVVFLVAVIFFIANIIRSITVINPLLNDIPISVSSVVVRVLVQVMPWILITGLVTGLGLVFVLPPSVALSYLVARRTVRRVETLTRATRALRHGDLSARVEVSGEDELAELQSDFNAMACDLQEATGELQAERDRVAGLLRTQRELTASVSHELRTPVATMRGYLDALQERLQDSPEEQRQDLDTVSRELDRLQTLIEDLFALSRAEVGQLALRIGPVSIGELVPTVVGTVAPLAWNSSRVQVLAELPLDLPSVQADPGRLEQILSNLLHNAVRHTPPGGLVAVTAAVEGNEVRLDVSDTGEGIPPEDLPHVWERFFQSNGSRPNGSAGLGLALVKELTEAMGGRVGVESHPGEGSRFSVWLKQE